MLIFRKTTPSTAAFTTHTTKKQPPTVVAQASLRYEKHFLTELPFDYTPHDLARQEEFLPNYYLIFVVRSLSLSKIKIPSFLGIKVKILRFLLGLSPRHGRSVSAIFSLAEKMAESGGFEPPVTLRPQRFSRPPHSTALPTLRAKFSL